MPIALSLFSGSAFVLVVLFALFKKETAREERIVLSAAREHLDTAVLKVGGAIAHFFAQMGAGTFRATIHYVLHQVLGVVIGGLTRVQRKLYELYERHTRMSREMRHSGGATHLNEIAAHKEETALTDAQKRKLRSRL